MISKKKIKVAIFGLGTVGGGTLQLLHKNADLILEKTGYQVEVVKAVVRNPKKKREFNLKKINLSSDADFILQDDSIDFIFEATGNQTLALRIIQTAFAKKKRIITANKALLAEQWQKISTELAQPNRVKFEAAVGGAIPIIDVLQNGLSANRINSVYGIINGTCNFILSKMATGDMDFQTALKEAKKLGYAETDPSLDIGGVDAAHKLVIMVNLIYRSIFDFSKLYIEGIEDLQSSSFHYAKAMGYKIKLLAIIKTNSNKAKVSKKESTKNLQIQASVHPTLVAETHLLANVEGVDNAIFLGSDFAGDSMLQGAGAGAKPTASAMVSDMIQMLIHKNEEEPSVKLSPSKKMKFLPMENACFEYFVEFKVEDEVGVLESISSIFSKNSVSIKKMLQDSNKKQVKNFSVHLAILTHSVKEKNMLATLKQLEQKKILKKTAKFIRVLSQ